MSDQGLLDVGHLRIVSSKRRRTLQKRGVPVRWSVELGAYVWEGHKAARMWNRVIAAQSGDEVARVARAYQDHPTGSATVADISAALSDS